MGLLPPSPQEELYAGWRRLVLLGLPVILLATVLTTILERNDFWDTHIDPPLNWFLGVGLVGLWGLVWARRVSVQQFTVALVVGAGIFLLSKLLLLSLFAPSAPLFLDELAQSFFWLPVLLAYAVMMEFSVLVRRAVLGLLLSLNVLTMLMLLVPALHQHWFDRSVVQALLQLNLALVVGHFGALYLVARNEIHKHWQGQNELLRHLAVTDLLTGLPERQSLEQRLSELTQSSQTPFALLFIDVDSFKNINDTLGHAQGDRLLQKLSAELRRLAPPEGEVFRLSGDEFVVLLPNHSAEEAEGVAAQLQTEATILPSSELGVVVSISTGLSLFPEDARTPAELLRHADSAMYAVKRSGRGQFRRYHPQQDAQTERFQQLAHDLGFALSRGELYLVYQPVYRLADQQLVKVEALLRWNHPQMGAVSPLEFIPIAERTGFISGIGQWVLRRACSAVRVWPDLTVSVNVSPIQLIQSSFATELARLLGELNFPAERLELEITEMQVLHEDERALSTLQAIRALGVQISIDDFGSGYSNITRLYALPITGVKLDRSMTRLGTHHKQAEFSRALIEAAISIAQKMGVSLTAEGIETAEQLHLLRGMGCELGQGYGLSLPLPIAELTELLDGISAVKHIA